MFLSPLSRVRFLTKPPPTVKGPILLGKDVQTSAKGQVKEAPPFFGNSFIPCPITDKRFHSFPHQLQVFSTKKITGLLLYIPKQKERKETSASTSTAANRHSRPTLRKASQCVNSFPVSGLTPTSSYRRTIEEHIVRSSSLCNLNQHLA